MRRGIYVIFLLGVVSLFADITYEGARGIMGPFLFTLGARAGIVGLASGLGEFIGYGLRLLSGYIADKTKSYWSIAILGYFVNLVAVPSLAFVGSWEFAVALSILERFGKAIRTPARDTIISFASSKIGYGKAFGIHEALDQIGAILGPLIVSAVLYRSESYEKAFLLLGIPAVLSLLSLLMTAAIYPKPESLKSEPEKLSDVSFNRVFLLYVFFSMLTVCGYPHFQIMSYHFKKVGVVSDAVIPGLFALAMAVDAIFALILGGLFDRFKLKLLVFIPFFSLPISIFAFLWRDFLSVVISAILWGVVMAFHETVMKSSVAFISPSGKIGSAFGIFHSFYGFAWLLGSFAFGKLYEISIIYLILFSVVFQIFSLISFVYLVRSSLIERR